MKAMIDASVSMAKEVLDGQREQWQSSFSTRAEMFGGAPSDPARKAVELFRKEGIREILELGPGQGRDTIFFAQNGFRVRALDYCPAGLEAIAAKARRLGLSDSITVTCHDVRQPLPFGDESVEACYSHMLYCMALTTAELERLSEEVRRVLKPAGLNIYTVRHTGDAHYGTGVHRGEDMYEVGGFIVHFFSKEKVVRLAKGYQILGIDEFEEGGLPRKLFRVTLRKEVENAAKSR